MTETVRALDIGYGNVKFVASRTQSNLTPKIFPSLAPRATDTDLAGDFVRRRDTRRVLVNGHVYEVGPDVRLAQRGNEIGRMLRDDYCLSDHYRALVYGGLLQMTRNRELDVLVLGLPVNTYRAYKERLAAAYTGTFVLDEEGKTCTIHKVVVVPQPLGGFFDYAVSNKILASLSRSTSLVVDPGYCTLDWLVTDGTTPVDARSGARANGGMGEVMKAVFEQIARDAECPLSDVQNSAERIDRWLRTDDPIRLNGAVLNVRSNADYIKIAQSSAQDALQVMMDSVGSVSDIDHIILVGGGSHVYAELLKQKFPKRNIITLSDSVFANVRGFQLLGEMWLAKQGRK